MMYETKTKWTYEEIKKLNYASLVAVSRASLVTFIVLQIVLLIGVAVSALLNRDSWIFTFGLACILFPVFLYFSMNRQIKRSYESNKMIQKDVTTFQFRENEFEELSERGNKVIQYDELFAVQETKTNFYLYISKMQAYNIIKANCSPELISFLQELKTRVKN